MATNKMEIDIYLKSTTEAQDEKDTVVGRGTDIDGLSQQSTIDSIKTPQAKQLRKFVRSQTVSVFLNNTRDLITSNVGLVTGRRDIQQRVDLGLQVAQKTVNTLSNARAGATLTMAMGLGGGVGAVVGVALSAVSFAINTAFAKMQLDLQAQLEDRQIKNTKNHLGAWYNRSRTG